MEQRELNELAKKLIGENDLRGVIEWYKRALKSDARFVVYVVRRSYILAILLEKITGEKMEDSEERSFITDSAFLLCCEKLAENYRLRKQFPSILLCDDILIHGRNLNRIIKNIEERLFELLEDFEEEQTIRDTLAEAIQINVYCYATNGPLRLRNRYRKNTECFVKYEPVKWRELSSHISSFIVESGVANASYINSEVIHAVDFEKLRMNEFEEHYFQNVEGYTKIRFLKNENNEVYAICTLRLLKNKVNDLYRVIPLVFMPNLDENETEILFDNIKTIGLKKGYPEEFFEQIAKLNDITGKRLFNEWITLIVSQAMLQEFHEEKQIAGCFMESEAEEDFEHEISRLIRNYETSWNGQNDVASALRRCLKDAPIFSNVDELDQVLKESNMRRPIFTIEPDELSANKNDETEIISQYFYGIGYEEEREALQDTWESDWQSDVSRRTVRGCCFVYKELLTGSNCEEAKEKVSRFLFLMDAGVMSLSSLAPSDVRVVGFAQFAKAGEQSLLIEPLKYMEYIPFLSLAYEWSEKLGEDFGKHLEQYYASPYCEIADETKSRLMKFVARIKKINQKVSDWNGSYYEKIDQTIVNERDFLKRQYVIEEKRIVHVEHYKDFLTTLMKNV